MAESASEYNERIEYIEKALDIARDADTVTSVIYHVGLANNEALVGILKELRTIRQILSEK